MLHHREPYKSTFKLLTFLGFWDEIPIWQKRLTLKIPMVFGVGFAVSVAFSILQAENFEDTLDALKIVPLLIVIIFSALRFIQNKSELAKLLGVIREIELENPEAVLVVDCACKLVKGIFIRVLSFSSMLLLLFLISPYLIGKLSFAVYVPEVLKNNKPFFYGMWAFQGLSGSYCTLINILIHEFRCSLLIVLDRIMRCFRLKLQELRAERESPEIMQKELQKCINLHIRIKE
jgi:hypothetical protein